MITLSSNGALHWLNASLELRRSWSPSSNSQQLLRSFITSIRDCSCVSVHEKDVDGILLFSFVTTTAALSLRIHTVIAERELTEIDIPVCDVIAEVRTPLQPY